MRYRPFGASGKAVSAVSLLLRETSAAPTAQAWRGLLFGAMECGINSFEMVAGSDILARGMNEAMRAVERGLLFLSWRYYGDVHRPLGADELAQSIRDGLGQSAAGYFDLLMLDEAAFQTLTPEAESLLADMKSAGLVLQIGVFGDGPVADACVATQRVDVLSSPFNLVSDGRTRRRVKDAAEANMAVVAYDAIPADLCRTPQQQQKTAGLLRRASEPLAGIGTYAFLHDTRGWSADELCLGYALTEPSFASIQIDSLSTNVIERLAAVTERDLPTGVVAQIEMARFGRTEGTERRRA
ncbi:MAG TPA: aldo/keto reductase [Phenylobacterium sp.]